VRKENETFKEVRQDILKDNISSTSVAQQNQDPPMYDMPSSMDHTSKGQPLDKVSTIKTFLQSCVKLLNEPSSIKVLQNLLEICNTKVEGKLDKKTVNHRHTIRM
jgi:hypothetical protein